ncbi:MAG TPA: response regulator [Acidimicrobiales bacterium]|nr:response regulator [Acidimicrobiales bacterium]
MALVLVVDDEADIRRLVRFTLELDGHTVLEALDGVDALRALDDARPDLIVLDLTMPRLDGWDLLVQLKAKGGDRAAVPVILLTALEGDTERIRAGIEGAVRYLTKPFDADGLRAEVARALAEPEREQRRRAAGEALERLAALERGDTPTTGGERPARPRLSRLGPPAERPTHRPAPRLAREAVADLSPRQRELLEAVASTPTVLEAAEQLGVSRSNVYASLRRIARRLHVASVPDLVTLAREGVGDDAA